MVAFPASHPAGEPPLLGPAIGRYLRRLVAPSEPAGGAGAALRVGAGEMVFPPGARFGPRTQAAYEIILPQQGGLVIEIDGAPLRLTPGDAALLHPPQCCVFRFDQHVETRVTYVSAYDPALPLAMIRQLDTPAFVLPASPAMLGLMETMRGLVDRPAPPTSALAWLITSTVALYADEALAAGKIGRGDGAAREHPAIGAVREVVRQRLSDPIGLSDLAEAAHVAPEHLVRLFRRRLGTTPIRFLWAARVRQGVHLLEHSELPVGEVAARVGCQSPKHFARLIRAAVGASPREVRRRTLVVR